MKYIIPVLIIISMFSAIYVYNHPTISDLPEIQIYTDIEIEQLDQKGN